MRENLNLVLMRHHQISNPSDLLDGNSVKDLKMAAPNISRSLTRLLNESLSTGKFPSVWKTIKVTPLFKGGTTTDCDNYRPISVLPSISKIFESFANSDFAFNNTTSSLTLNFLQQLSPYLR